MKNVSKKLGIDTNGEKLTKTVCLDKVRKLKAGLARNKFKGELRKYAVYYKNWYAWRAKKGPRSA